MDDAHAQARATDLTLFFNKCIEVGRPFGRVSPPDAQFLRDHPEFLEAYGEASQTCAIMTEDLKRGFVCLGKKEGHDDEQCIGQPSSLTELKTAPSSRRPIETFWGLGD